jgi:hypothetical protein
MEKHSSLLRKVVKYGEIKFSNIGPCFDVVVVDVVVVDAAGVGVVIADAEVVDGHL